MYCFKCGFDLKENFAYCPSCGNELKNEFVYCNSCQTNSTNEELGYNKNINNKIVLSNLLKVLIISGIILIPFFGYIGGIIVGIIFMNNDVKDTKTFGKSIFILSIVLISLIILIFLTNFISLIFYDSFDFIEHFIDRFF